MKKIIGYLLLVVILVFAIPILFTNQKKTVQTNSNLEQENTVYEKFDYGNYSNVRLLHTKTRRNRKC